VRKLISKRAVGVAAATVVLSGVAATGLASTAFADPGPMLLATKTVITQTTQLANDSNGAVLQVDVQVTAQGGSTSPSGLVVVDVGSSSNSCNVWLKGQSGGTASSGSCDVHGLSDQTYNVWANYKGYANWSGSPTTASTQATLAGSTASDVVSSLSCSSSVTVGRSGSCTLTVTNDGSSTATGVTASITLPSRLTARSCGHGGGWGWWSNRGGGCSLNGNTATWAISSLAAGASKAETLNFSASQNGYGNSFGRHHRTNTVTVWGSADTSSQSASNSKATVVIHPRQERWGWFW
jgi:uncharacterized repeat protein (TIGR01451 family)